MVIRRPILLPTIRRRALNHQANPLSTSIMTWMSYRMIREQSSPRIKRSIYHLSRKLSSPSWKQTAGTISAISSVYDLLEEKFIENGDFKALPGNEQTLRNYVRYLEDAGVITREPEHRRIYDYVFDTPPGEQMLIDFGELTLDARSSIHFICLLLRYSRFLCVYAQDHKV